METQFGDPCPQWRYERLCLTGAQIHQEFELKLIFPTNIMIPNMDLRRWYTIVFKSAPCHLAQIFHDYFDTKLLTILIQEIRAIIIPSLSSRAAPQVIMTATSGDDEVHRMVTPVHSDEVYRKIWQLNDFKLKTLVFVHKRDLMHRDKLIHHRARRRFYRKRCQTMSRWCGERIFPCTCSYR